MPKSGHWSSSQAANRNHPPVPRYCRHKGTGQAVVYVNRRAIYLGEYGSDESFKKYRLFVERWKADPAAEELASLVSKTRKPDATVAELISRWAEWAIDRYTAGPLGTGYFS